MLAKSDFLFLEKPQGWSTHSPAPDSLHIGLHEWASHLSAEKLFVCHRLDRETSGAILFAKNIEAARELGRAFENHEVQKTYFFLTKSKTSKSHFDYSSFIEKSGNKFVSGQSQPANSQTSFEKINSLGEFELWKAIPKSGKPHQIRLHAQALGMPILGDREHGGAPFSRMMLHSHSLQFQTLQFLSDLPYVFENLDVLKNFELANWMSTCERRFWWLKNAQELTGRKFLQETNSWRWLHTETKNLRAEQLGENTFFYWYADQMPNASQIKNVELLFDHITHMNQKLMPAGAPPEFFLQLRSDRQKAPREFGEVKSSAGFPKRWKIKENDLHYELRIDSGLSTGLFLDQRNNRDWVMKNSKNKMVLNLFSYTGGFSLCAARGGAEKVVTVDVSANFLDWSKVNFQLNEISIEGHEFRKIDSLEYLAWAKKKSLRFDLIICDPPSFSRADKKIFKIDKQLPELVELLIAVLAPGGKILFCTNFEEMNSQEFLKALQKNASAREFNLLREDFELPPDETLMKSYILT